MCNLYSSKDLHTAIIVKKAGNKSEYTLSDNSYTSFNHVKTHVLFIMFMFLSAWQDHTNLCILF